MMYARQVNHMCHYATDEELDWMSDFGAEMSVDQKVVMLGAGPGVLLLALKDKNADLSAHVIDIMRTEYTRAYLLAMSAEQNVTYETSDSTKAARAWTGDIDLLIVDTDHTEMTTRREIDAWLPHVRAGGYIFFHDYDATGTWFEGQEQYPGVKVAVDEVMAPWMRVGRVGTAVIYRKEPNLE